MKFIKWASIFTAMAFVFTTIFSFSGENSAQAASDYQIEINKTTNYLYLYKGGKVVSQYRVATGRSTSLTPEGTFKIIIKIVQPGWTSPDGEQIPGGDPKNPLGPRWLGLQVNGDNGRTYGIHGTNNPSSIGSHASSGCVRMLNEQITQLYNTVSTGTMVWIHTGTSDGVWRGEGSGQTPAPTPTTPVTGKLTVSVNLANIRAAASLNSKVVQRVSRGTVLNQVGVSGEFYKIKLKSGAYAYVHKSVVTSGGGTSTPVPTTPATGKLTVSVNLANIRAAASLNSKVLQRVSRGTVLNKVGVSGEFYKIKLKSGAYAYVHKSVVTSGGSTTPATGKLTVSVNLANIRASASLNSKVLQRVSRGTVLNKVGVSGEFYKIKLKSGAYAYVHKSVVK
jgi:hypothetical protein